MTKLEIEIIRDLVDNSDNSYYHFFLNFWDTICAEELVENFHIKELCDYLQNIGYRVINREAKLHDYNIINISPSESKSSICTQLFPVWLWVKDPTIRIISTSYAERVSSDHAEKSRDCILSDKFQKCFGHLFKLRNDSKSKTNYKTTAGGQRFTTSPGGSATGIHAHIHINDDILNPKQVNSKKILETTNKFFFETLSSRTTDAKLTPSIVVMQRLDEEDTTGKILEKAEKGECTVSHVKLPASCDFDVQPPSLKEKYKDGIMNPFRHPKTVLDNKIARMGATTFACQYGQTPVALEGNIVKKKWFKRFTFDWLEDYAHEHSEIITWNFAVDGAETENAQNDATAIIAYCKVNSRTFIRKVQSVRKELLKCVDFIKRFADENGYTDESEIRVEPKSSGRQIEQVFKELLPSYNVILDESPKVDKVTRVKAKVPFIETNKCYLLEDAIWIDSFLTQVGGFPNLKHDDEVDCLVIAINQTQKQNEAVWKGGF